MKWMQTFGAIILMTTLSWGLTLSARADEPPPPPSGYEGSDLSSDDEEYATSQTEDFDSALSPYGEWIDLPPYGRVWNPNSSIVGSNFRPYVTGGHWIYTDLGWSFESDADWGRIVYHYGRWLRDSTYGWVWVPGTEWAPSWCEWRMGDQYIGWAPLPPAGTAIGTSNAYIWWTFVPAPYFISADFYRYVIPRPRFVTIFPRTSIVRDTHVYQKRRFPAGPRIQRIRPIVQSPISSVHIVPPRPGIIGRPRYYQRGPKGYVEIRRPVNRGPSPYAPGPRRVGPPSAPGRTPPGSWASPRPPAPGVRTPPPAPGVRNQPPAPGVRTPPPAPGVRTPPPAPGFRSPPPTPGVRNPPGTPRSYNPGHNVPGQRGYQRGPNNQPAPRGGSGHPQAQRQQPPRKGAPQQQVVPGPQPPAKSAPPRGGRHGNPPGQGSGPGRSGKGPR